MVSLRPNKRLKSCQEGINYNLCIICQTATKSPTSSCSEHSLSKIKEDANLRNTYGCKEYINVVMLLQDVSVIDITQKKAIYHRHCYQNLTSAEKILRLEKNFKEGAVRNLLGEKKRGRPQTVAEPQRMTIPNDNADKNKCILCQEISTETLHKVSTQNMGLQLKEVGENSHDSLLRARLSDLYIITSPDPLAAVAYDVKYHLTCLIKHKRLIKKERTEVKTSTSNTCDLGKMMSDLELIDVIQQELNNSECRILNMSDINTTYVNILQENECPLNDPPDYKKYLKQIILENIPDVHFNRPLQRNKPEQLLSTKTKEAAVSMAIEASMIKEDIQVLMKAAQILRKDIAQSPKWKFEGTFNNYSSPKLLYTFCRQLVQGKKEIQTERRKSYIDKTVSLLSQHIVQSIHSDKQVSYCPKDEKSLFHSSIETPLSVGLALNVHKLTRSKVLVETLHALNISISYSKLMEIETGIATAVHKNMQNTGGICLPSFLVNNEFVWFAVDNIDFLEATPSGMNTLHGTALAVYQSDVPEKLPFSNRIEIDRKYRAQTLPETMYNPSSTCTKPVPRKKVIPFKHWEELTAPNFETAKQTDTLWAISFMQLKEVNKEPPGTWAAFNSLTSTSQPKTNVSLTAPLLRSPPTDYNTLFTVLKRAQGITFNVMGYGHMTVVSADLQLYDMLMKLWVDREDIQRDFIFRPGELHIVFWALAALGTYIEGSGIDQAWVEAGLYSATTVTKILAGKNMYRALEAHTVTLLALYHLYFEQLTAQNPEMECRLREISLCLRQGYEDEVTLKYKGNLKSALSNSIEILSRDDISKLELLGEENNMQKFVLNYMKQFLAILQFVRATRQNDLLLHLVSTEVLMKYFFAHDHQNYSRLLSLYLSSMHHTEIHHPDIWKKFLDGEFGISGSRIPFTTRAPDHALENENRKLKVIGGIVGLTQNDKALDRFFMIAPELSRLVDEFEVLYETDVGTARKEHHEISGSKLQRTIRNVSKLKHVIVEHGNPFLETETDLHNFMTKEVMPESKVNDIVNRDIIGQKMFEEFTQTRLVEGKLSVWDRMNKAKLKTFKSSNATKKVQVGQDVIKIKEERGLLQRFIIAARSRPELDLKECIMHYEFGVIPRSLFASDGSLLLPYDKSKVLHMLEDIGVKFTNERNSDEGHDTSLKRKVVIIDGMALVHCIQKTPSMVTCEDLAAAFIQKLIRTAENFDEVRLVFDRYIENSLKEQMRLKRTGGKETYYRISDKTSIRHISLKDLLGHIKTKGELVEYLADKAFDKSISPDNRLKTFMVTAGTVTRGNTIIPEMIRTHSQEEADTLMLLHASSIDKTAEVVIQSPDTDVLILMIKLHKTLPSDISFVTGRGKDVRRIPVGPICKGLGEKRAEAILAWHVFTGCDVTGRFAGKTKDWCFKVFLQCGEKTLDALTCLGKSNNHPADDTVEELEHLICLIYKSKTYSRVGELRWHMYSNKQAQAEQLPPTSGSMLPMVHRAHYITRLQIQSTENHPQLPSPTEYGWTKSSDGKLVPVMCRNPPAPEAILLLIKCNCKTGCNKASMCSCLRHNMTCTEVCGCAEYECHNVKTNIEAEIDSPSSDTDSSDTE